MKTKKQLLVLLMGVVLTTQVTAQGVTEKWVSTYNGSRNISDKALAMVIDNNGNSYVTGKSYENGIGTGYGTVKYNSAGVERWTATYNGTGSWDDEAIAIAVDDNGNVYVTGKSHNGSNYDYATIKYNSHGVEQWVATYNAGDDYAKALAVDNAGNVYVTGNSKGGTYDWVTVKYNSNGVEQWVERYNRANFNDGVSAIAVDGVGNVYLTGGSVGCFGCPAEYTTIKYNTNGVLKWKRHESGMVGPWGKKLWGKASALAIDDAGNVYVTGNSFFDTWGTPSYSFGSQYFLYITVKYDSTGSRQWYADDAIVPIDDPVGIAVDASGNVYIAGSQNGNGGAAGPAGYDNYVTIKRDANGARLWTAFFNDLRHYSDGSVGNTIDHAKAMTIDDAGNVYVTGNSYYSGNNYDIATVKYNTNGAEQWRMRFNGNRNQNDDAAAIAVDASGKNVYVSGSVRNSSLYTDYVTIKYTSRGNGNGGHGKTGSDISSNDTENETISGTDEYFKSETSLNVYPNPTSGIFAVEYSSDDFSAKGGSASGGESDDILLEVRLLNITGQLIYQENIGQFTGIYRKQIDLTAYPKGIYYLQMITDKGVENRKVVVQ